jgi:hypothetical protein
LSQETLIKPTPSQALLKFNIPNIDSLFRGFAPGEFATLHGMSTVLPLSLLLTVRAQLPYQLGGLETNPIFIDGGNTFRLYEVSHIAQMHQLDPKQTLQRIHISRAFTAHQMAAIILQKLKETAQRLDSKLITVSSIAELFLDKDVPAREAKEIFNQLTVYLSEFAKESGTIIIATDPQHHHSRRHSYLSTMICSRAETVIAIKPARFGKQFILEKHPTLCLGRAEFPSDNLTLNDFTEA